MGNTLKGQTMRRLLAPVFTLTFAAQSALACVLPPPMMGAVFVQESVKGGEWRFLEIGGLTLPDQPLMLTLGADGQFRARGWCNDLVGPYQGDPVMLDLDPVVEPVAHCEADIESFDNQMQALLQNVTLYSLSQDGQTLYLTTADSQQIRLERLSES
jgi:heat shock protein HslJ